MMDEVVRKIVDKGNPSLMLFNIFGDFIGIGVYNPQTITPDEYNPEDDVMQSMGFDNTDDYRNAYPGKCLSNSALCIASKWGYVFDDKSAEPPEIVKWMTVRYAPIPKCGDPYDVARTIYDWSANKPINANNIMWITQPKMSQICQLPVFKDANKKNLWFCEDWQE